MVRYTYVIVIVWTLSLLTLLILLLLLQLLLLLLNFKLLNDTVYDYFSANHLVKLHKLLMKAWYEGKSKNDLKKSLKVLKQFANAGITEIKYVSRLLRDILRDNTSCQVNADLINHDYSISKNFWGCQKDLQQKRWDPPFVFHEWVFWLLCKNSFVSKSD